MKSGYRLRSNEAAWTQPLGLGLGLGLDLGQVGVRDGLFGGSALKWPSIYGNKELIMLRQGGGGEETQKLQAGGYPSQKEKALTQDKIS